MAKIEIIYGLRITDYGLRITDYGLRITDYGLRITDYELRITNPPSNKNSEGEKFFAPAIVIRN
jgi:hypothetical protein